MFLQNISRAVSPECQTGIRLGLYFESSGREEGGSCPSLVPDYQDRKQSTGCTHHSVSRPRHHFHIYCFAFKTQTQNLHKFARDSLCTVSVGWDGGKGSCPSQCQPGPGYKQRSVQSAPPPPPPHHYRCSTLGNQTNLRRRHSYFSS